MLKALDRILEVYYNPCNVHIKSFKQPPSSRLITIPYAMESHKIEEWFFSRQQSEYTTLLRLPGAKCVQFLISYPLLKTKIAGLFWGSNYEIPICNL